MKLISFNGALGLAPHDAVAALFQSQAIPAVVKPVVSTAKIIPAARFANLRAQLKLDANAAAARLDQARQAIAGKQGGAVAGRQALQDAVEALLEAGRADAIALQMNDVEAANVRLASDPSDALAAKDLEKALVALELISTKPLSYSIPKSFGVTARAPGKMRALRGDDAAVDSGGFDWGSAWNFVTEHGDDIFNFGKDLYNTFGNGSGSSGGSGASGSSGSSSQSGQTTAPPDPLAQAFCASNPSRCSWNGSAYVPVSAVEAAAWWQNQQGGGDELPKWAIPAGAGVLILALAVILS